MLSIDVGCSNLKLPGHVGVDCRKNSDADIVAEWNNLPLRDNSVSVFFSRHCLEHVPDAVSAVREMFRVCRHNARATIVVPHFSSPRFFEDLTHIRPLSVYSFDHFDHIKLASSGHPIYAIDPDIRVINTRLIFWTRRSLVGKPFHKYVILLFLCTLIEFFANLSPFICERFWCRLVGGFEEVWFTLRIVKK